MSALIVSCALLAAVVGKCLRFETFRHSLEPRLRSRSRASWLASAVLLLEVSVAASMWTPARELAAVALLAFLHGASVWLVTGDAARHSFGLPDCQCFGFGYPWSTTPWIDTSALKPAWWVLRNGGIAGLSIDIVASNVGIQRALAIGITTISFVSLSAILLAIRQARRPLLPALYG